jgi:large subunit ribosomal protein L24
MSTRNFRFLARLRRNPPAKQQTNFYLFAGDKVFIRAGRDSGEWASARSALAQPSADAASAFSRAGKVGVVKRVDRKRARVIVEGAKMVKKHVRASQLRRGGVFLKEAPIHYSNVMLVDPATGKPTRVRRIKVVTKQMRVALTSGAIIAKPMPPARPPVYVNPDKDTPAEEVLKRTYFEDVEIPQIIATLDKATRLVSAREEFLASRRAKTDRSLAKWHARKLAQAEAARLAADASSKGATTSPAP